MSKQRVMQLDLAVGKPLQWDVYDNGGKLLLRKGHVIATESQLERLVDAGMFVETEQKSTHVAVGVTHEKEHPSALKAILSAREIAWQISRGIKSPEFDLVAKVRQCAAQISTACEINRDVAIAAILLRQEGSYAIRHQVDVATVSLLVARDIELPEAECQAIVAAALTMNLSMIDVQDKLDSLRGELVPAMRKVLLEHPRKSVELLRARGVEDVLWLDMVAQHHEREDGSGYWSGLCGEQILQGAKIIALADRYCARVCNRPERPRKQPSSAIREIFNDRGSYADAELTTSFVKTIGIYPAGTMVRLTGGEIGIVTKTLDRVSNPIVHALLGLHGAPLTMPLPRNTSQALHTIQEAVDPKKVNLTVRMFNLWGKDASES